MGIDHSNPYIHSTTVLCDVLVKCALHLSWDSMGCESVPYSSTIVVNGSLIPSVVCDSALLSLQIQS